MSDCPTFSNVKIDLWVWGSACLSLMVLVSIGDHCLNTLFQ